MAEQDDADDFDDVTKLDIFLPVILNCVNGAELVPYMSDILPDGEMKKIRLIARNESPSAATEYLVKLIKQEDDGQTDRRRRWRSFMNALDQADYPFVSKVLQCDTGYSLNHENQTRIIKCLAPYISKRLIPKEINSYLLNKGIINDRDVEEITAEETNYGSFAGAIILLDKINCRVDDWYRLFLEVLYEVPGGGYRHIAREIDEDFVNKKEIQQEEANNALKEIKMTETEQNINRQSEVKKAQNDQNTTEHCQYDTKGDNCPSDNKGDNCPSDNKGDNCPSDTKGDNCPSYTKGDNYLSASGPAFDKVNDLNSPPSVNKHTKSDEMAFRIGKMNKDHSEKTIPKEVDCTSGNVDYVFDGSKNLHDLSNQTDEVANDMSNQIDDVANGLSNQTDDSADQTYVKLELDDAQTFVDKEEISDKKLEDIFENILYMENVEDKVKNTFTLAFNPDFLLEPNITEEEGDSEDDLYEVQSVEDNEIIKKVLELRGYQEELARPGNDGINTIVIAPTGSGKTHVAMGIIQNHFEVMKDRMVPKAVLIVNNSTLASQHFHELQTYLDFSVKCITGASQDKVKSLSTFVSRRDILIVTAQIWLNSLMEKDTTINAFTLVIFDECHHCAQKHPYNKIMEFYMDAKLKDNARDINLPQIIGLTASVNIGKSKEKNVAKEKIVQLMSNLDVHVVSTVRSFKGEQELKEHVQLACDETRTVPEREKQLIWKTDRSTDGDTGE
ncbi:hypothetical protein KUTeg_006362 [Tegillarca granosa]|uniref:Helicase ATP-binding domain-containing protein n=1 Tax=Tegillarca granosa TaxID=220873 RepID=A0ABQ9FKU7_TEGGR|nr:hypothetical protein KUTeg_006362 [Tegillarca granosa]